MAATMMKGTLQGRIEVDPDPSSPREWDNFGTIVAWHRRYSLGDRDTRDLSPAAFELEAKRRKYIMRPVYMMDHSGLSLDVTADRFRAVDAHGWDWDQIGWIYVDRAKVRETYMVSRITRNILVRALRLLRLEIEAYSSYLSGDMYGYVIEDEAGEVVESCWGYHNYQAAEEDLKEALENASATIDTAVTP